MSDEDKKEEEPTTETNETNQEQSQPNIASGWDEVSQQFMALGNSLASALKATVDSEENRQYLDQMQAGISEAAAQISKATQDAVNSEEAQKVKSEVGKAAAAAKEAGQQTADSMQPHILEAFRKIRTELDGVISRMESTPTTTDEIVETDADAETPPAEETPTEQ